MRKYTVLAIVTLAVLVSIIAHASDKMWTRQLNTLETSKVGRFPRRWRTWPFQRKKAAKVYRVAEENGLRFIKAYDDHDASQQIFLNFHWPIEKRPIVSWSWRATTLPQGANESNDATNDSACGMYVLIGRYKGHAIKYVWSTSLPPGTVVTRRGGKLKIKVLDSGYDKMGQWINHSVDVLSDYQALFGRPLKKNPSGIGILTDGNAVHKPAGCDYTDFIVSSKPK